VSRKTREQEVIALDDDPLWYKDAILYEIHIRAFMDSNGDGIGDFPGLIEKLDYLQDLGVTALWLLPFYPSPLRDDGYDIADYSTVNPIYGNLGDFKRLLEEAHRRGLRVVTELVVNHTSDQHPWFQRARRAPPGSPPRDFYVWSDNPERFKDARIIFKDFESSNWTWDPLAKAYYWHRFYSHQPDLNYDNPLVHEAVFQALDYWMDMGVDGVRLDAIPYLYEREGTNCENLSETHTFLKKLRRHVDEKYRNRLLLAEANQWPEDAVAYFGDGGGAECHMCFHFPIMPRLFMAIQMEDRHPIIDILQQTPAIPENSQWALFLRNHDELTLEMVTEDDRDYMYRVYAQDPQARINLGIRRRLAPLLQNNRAKIELMNGLLLSLPGTPVLYYGDEIGMGDNIYLGDRNGVRTPMQWGPGRNAGFSTANPQKLYLPAIFDPEFHFEAVNVEAQQNNVHSLLWWTKRLLDLRKRHQAFGRGDLHILSSDNPKTLAFIRRWGDESLLIVANLSRFAQCTWIDLSEFKGTAPVEMLGRSKFPPISEGAYCLTLGPYAFYWFTLMRQGSPLNAEIAEPPTLTVSGSAGWESVFRGKAKLALEEALPAYLQTRRWYQGRFRTLKAVTIRDAVAIPRENSPSRIALVQVDYVESDPEIYLLPLAFAPDSAPNTEAGATPPVVARLRVRPRGEGEAVQGVLYEPCGDRTFIAPLLDVATKGGRLESDAGDLRGEPSPNPAPLPDGAADAAPRLVELSNTSAILEGRGVLLKLYRRVEEGPHPEVEILRYFARTGSFPHTPRLLGVLEYKAESGEAMTAGLLREFAVGEGDAWNLTLDSLSRFFDHVLTGAFGPPDLEAGPRSVVDLSEQDVPPQALELLGAYLETARLIARRTAEMHVALASGLDDPAFAPEAFTAMYQRSLYQSMRGQIRKTLERLRRSLEGLPEALHESARRILHGEEDFLRLARRILDKITSVRIRCHGDYHLKHLVSIGSDFLVVDFEGEADRPLSHRRRKRSPIRDLTSLHRSLQEAAQAALLQGNLRAEDVPTLRPWALFWQRWASVVFLKEYRAAPGTAALMPQDAAELRLVFEFYRLGWSIHRLGRELEPPSENLELAIQNAVQMLAPPE
jgi:maltose alpha-D-glucosyltransferase / alpha-amylase